uniref:Uncharacterized protein n=1 Tax=Anguilla anguilla TaxID=7936 RepID=A0A0E9X609_ANGAN
MLLFHSSHRHYAFFQFSHFYGVHFIHNLNSFHLYGLPRTYLKLFQFLLGDAIILHCSYVHSEE